jgi:hypothetical protein
MSEKKQPTAFDLAIKRSICGEKVILKTVSDDTDIFWIVPKKFSVEGIDEWTQYQMTIRKSYAKSTISRKIREKFADKNLDPNSPTLQSDVLSSLSNDEVEELVADTPIDASLKMPLLKIFLKNGIGRHNLYGEESEKVDSKLIDSICEHNALAIEIFEVINNYNDFLSRKA